MLCTRTTITDETTRCRHMIILVVATILLIINVALVLAVCYRHERLRFVFSTHAAPSNDHCMRNTFLLEDDVSDSRQLQCEFTRWRENQREQLSTSLPSRFSRHPACTNEFGNRQQEGK